MGTNFWSVVFVKKLHHEFLFSLSLKNSYSRKNVLLQLITYILKNTFLGIFTEKSRLTILEDGH